MAALPGNCEVYVDQTGEAGVQCLAEYGRLNARVHGFDYGRADAKAHLMSQPWQWIQQNKVRIYDQATLDQLIAFRFHLSSTGHEILGDSSRADDRVNALALAVEGAAQMQLVDRQRPFLIAKRDSRQPEWSVLDRASSM